MYSKNSEKFCGYLLHYTDGNWYIAIGNPYSETDGSSILDWKVLPIKGEDITRIAFGSSLGLFGAEHVGILELGLSVHD